MQYNEKWTTNDVNSRWVMVGAFIGTVFVAGSMFAAAFIWGA